VRLHPALQRPRCILIGTSNHPTMPSTATSCCDRSPRGFLVMSSSARTRRSLLLFGFSPE
jgi:hypothetical protein